MLRINDVVRIINLPNDPEMNGRLAVVIAEEYVHPVFYVPVIKIKMDNTLWGIHLKNVEKVCEDERIDYFRNQEYNKLADWKDCAWSPYKKDVQNG